VGIFWKLCIVRCAFVARHIVDTVHVVCGPVESSNKVYETVRHLSVCLYVSLFARCFGKIAAVGPVGRRDRLIAARLVHSRK